ncbi:uncharacterized protein LOC131892260 [Tigriopus californicus]|uniref:uncharacterized protein LOC131892260 n=1 Tax=Tigriopus californicus TaxID=6832 RepID=UPI0027DA90F4|nr:uncharacterized protein LOC131892260 [Tigriopus californicus]
MSPKRGGHYCCVVLCHHNQKRDGKLGISFFRFPKNDPQRDLWLKAVRRKNSDGTPWIPNKEARICSAHFYLGKRSDDPDSPSFVPTVLPHKTVKVNEDRIARRKHRESVKIKSKTQTEEAKEPKNIAQEIVATVFSTQDLSVSGGSHASLNTEPVKCFIEGYCQTLKLRHSSGIFNLECETRPNMYDENCLDVATTANVPQHEDQGVQAVKYREIPSRAIGTSTENTHSDNGGMQYFLNLPKSHFQSLTGLSRKMFDFLLYKLGQNLTSSRFIQREMKLFLFLVKMKLNLPYIAMNAMFNVSAQTVSQIFVEVLKVAHDCTKNFIIWYDRKTIYARMPKSIKKDFPNAKVIIDASEVEIERLKSTKACVQTYSSYKSRHTLKFLVGCAPSGEIMFISKGFGGKATDAEITVRSGILNYLEPGDVVLADKGFPLIETKVNSGGGILVMPPFKESRQQFTEEKNESGYKCSSARIHVERCIERMKRFKVLDFIPRNLLEHSDMILVTIAGLCNLFPVLIRDSQGNEMYEAKENGQEAEESFN